MTTEHQSKKQKVVQRQGHIYDGQNRLTMWPEEKIRQCISVSTRHLLLSLMEQYTTDTTRIDTEWAYITSHSQLSSNSKLPKQLKLSVNGYQYLTRKLATLTLHEPVRNSSKDAYDSSNASFIYDSNPKEAVFIASQSPMPSTITQFWRMIWENKVSTIVMLAVIKDKGDVKGCRYWPKEGIMSFGQFEVCVVSKHAVCTHYLVRSLYIKDTISGTSRTVTQFQYKAWNDGEQVPSDLNTFLEFRRKIQRSNISCKTPMVVHCRDGLGRTGLFVLLDLALRKLIKDGDKIKGTHTRIEFVTETPAPVIYCHFGTKKKLRHNRGFPLALYSYGVPETPKKFSTPTEVKKVPKLTTPFLPVFSAFAKNSNFALDWSRNKNDGTKMCRMSRRIDWDQAEVAILSGSGDNWIINSCEAKLLKPIQSGYSRMAQKRLCAYLIIQLSPEPDKMATSAWSQSILLLILHTLVPSFLFLLQSKAKLLFFAKAENTGKKGVVNLDTFFTSVGVENFFGVSGTP
eukprot:sb/3463919/